MHLNSTYVLNILLIHHPKDLDKCNHIRRELRLLHKRNKGYVINSITFDGSDLSETGRAMLRDLVEAADLILVLMSDDAIMSPLFICQEMREVVQLQQQDKRVVVPIMLHTCWWEDTIYKNLHILPGAGLPLYDNPLMTDHLLDDLLNELQARIEIIRQRKLDVEESYKTILAEAERLYEQCATKPELLRKALPLYKEALSHWHEGFRPPLNVLETRVEVCTREMNFYHYAEAAKEAYRKGDHETAYFNCKDALEMREDAIIRRMYEKLHSQFKQEEGRAIREPFERHLKRGHEFFLNMQWDEAQEEYTHALEFHEDDFTPSRESIQHKIETCHREAVRETTMRKVRQLRQIQDYAQIVESLTNSLRDINREAFELIEHTLRMMRHLEEAEPYYDAQTQRWGYYNRSTQEVIIAPKYNAAFSFSENLAGVKKWERWGFIDIEGNEIIPFQYTFVGHFRNGVAEVVKDKEMFYINHRGERIPDAEVKHLK